MSDFARIRNSGEVLQEFDVDRYGVFAEKDSQNVVTIWQPCGKVENAYEAPEPIDFKQKAKSFLRRASAEDAQLAVAPEWGYDIGWIDSHNEYLFAQTGPLFVLGCAPVRIDEMQEHLDRLDDSYDCFSAEGDCGGTPCVPDKAGKEFVTPVIIPIAAGARPKSDRDALLVQFKNKHMSGYENDFEERKLSEGDAIWGLKFLSSDAVVVPWICSDVMDPELQNQVIGYSQKQPSYIVHVQCNPDPFHKTWINLRERLFETDTHVTCVVANWGREAQFGPFGYSGVYTSTPSSTTLGTEYNESYERGGLVATRPEYGCEYLCLIPEDIVSTVVFRRRTNSGTPSGAATMANLKVAMTAVFDRSVSAYETSYPVYPAEEPDICEEWRKELNLSPLNRELLCAILQAGISTDCLPEKFGFTKKLTWECIESLNGEEIEELGHLLENHPRRHGAGDIRLSKRDRPEAIAERLKKAISFARDEANIILKSDFDKSDVPVNAEYTWGDVPICLTTLSDTATRTEIKRAKWFKNWLELENIGFKPVVIAPTYGTGSVKTLAGYEDVSNAIRDPERVDANDGLEVMEL